MSAINRAAVRGAMPLPELLTCGWTTAVSNWALLKLQPDMASLLAETYQQARQINEWFRIRQQFSTTMGALDTYQQVLTNLDNGIGQDLARYLALSGQLQPTLEKLI